MSDISEDIFQAELTNDIIRELEVEVDYWRAVAGELAGRYCDRIWDVSFDEVMTAAQEAVKR